MKNKTALVVIFVLFCWLFLQEHSRAQSFGAFSSVSFVASATTGGDTQSEGLSGMQAFLRSSFSGRITSSDYSDPNDWFSPAGDTDVEISPVDAVTITPSGNNIFEGVFTSQSPLMGYFQYEVPYPDNQTIQARDNIFYTPPEAELTGTEEEGYSHVFQDESGAFETFTSVKPL